MQIKLAAKKVQAYDINVNGVALGRFDVASEWNGFFELRRADTQTLIVTRPHHLSFGEIFGDLFNANNEQEMIGVKASPDLILQMRVKEE
jgi:hypothetical protein